MKGAPKFQKTAKPAGSVEPAGFYILIESGVDAAAGTGSLQMTNLTIAVDISKAHR